MEGMDMGNMSMGRGMPTLNYMTTMFWKCVGAAIALATAVNVFNILLARQRLNAAHTSHRTASKPKNVFMRIQATTAAVLREGSYPSLAPITIRGRSISTPTVGRALIVLSYTALILILSFYKFDLNNRWQREDIGYRTGFVAICQLPLLFILAGKNNIIGWLTGSSHERLNWLHRWASRCLLLTVTIHMGYWFADWAPYNYIGKKIQTDPITRRGIAAWAILVWIVISSMTPIRGWSYEFFVIQHLVSFAAFIGMVYIHSPKEVHVWIWICVGFFLFDRVTRALFIAYNNMSIFHKRENTDGGFLACKAEFKPLPHNTTRVTIRNPPIHWKAGQHVFLACHTLVPLQSHPFTIASIPEDGKLEFLIKAEKGGTKKFFSHAEKHGLPTTETGLRSAHERSVTIDGPYGRIRPLRQFDSVVLFAGSTGATFVVPLLRDVVAGWTGSSQQSRIWQLPNGVVTRHLRLVWVVKSGAQLSWFAEQLSKAVLEVERLREQGKSLELDISVYVTCDEEFTSGKSSNRSKAKTAEHGRVEEVRLETGNSSTIEDEKRDIANKENVIIAEVDGSRPSSTASGSQTCGPNGTCCCKATVDEGKNSGAVVCTCCCGPSASKEATPAYNSSTSPGEDEKTAPTQEAPLHSGINVLSGRPHPRNIIRKSLEQALGETAVVVCGPKGLVRDVRMAVCYLSDERAVHKGTGAQGVYLHEENFGY